MACRAVRLVSLALITLGLSLPAVAEKNETDREGVKPGSTELVLTGSTELVLKSPVRLRGNTATLGKTQKRSRRPKLRRRPKAESRVVFTKKTRAPRARASKPVNPYQAAFQSLRLHAAEVDPSTGGRAEISFVVGKKGEPTRTAIVGISSTLTKALTAHLRTLRFPKEHAGQFFASKLSIVPTAAAKPRTKRAKKRRARRSPAVRKKK